MKEEAVICLQEVSEEERGFIECVASQNNYESFCTNYGNYFSGYMGTNTLIPRAKYSVSEIRYVRPNSFIHKLGLAPVTTSYFSYIYNWVWGIKTVDLKNELQKRNNVVSFARVREIYGEREFWIANYHAPCLYYAPEVSLMYNYLFSLSAKKIVGDSDAVFAGDFNYQPDSWEYFFITDPRCGGDEIYNTLQIEDFIQLKDARKHVSGNNRSCPSHTCKSFSKIYKQEAKWFEGTIDYFFQREVYLASNLKYLELPKVTNQCLVKQTYLIIVI